MKTMKIASARSTLAANTFAPLGFAATASSASWTLPHESRPK